MSDPFQPAWWLPGPHLQTLWNPFFRRAPRLARQRERLWLADGDFIDLDWHGPHEASAPLVLVLHGLTGSSSSLYVLGLQQQLAARGWASVAINWRGCSGEPNLLPRAYQILNVLDDTHRALTNLSGEVSGRLTLATSHHIGLHRLPALLRCEPVSRHMRYLLYGLAVLLIVLEVGGLDRADARAGLSEDVAELADVGIGSVGVRRARAAAR